MFSIGSVPVDAMMKRDAEADGPDAGEHHQPLGAELRAAAQGDDELRRTAEQGPHAEHGQDVSDAARRGRGEGGGGDGADRGAGEQHPPGGAALAARVDQRGGHVDQRIDHNQDPGGDRYAGRQRVRHGREHGGPGDGHEAADEEELHGDAPWLVR